MVRLLGRGVGMVPFEVRPQASRAPSKPASSWHAMGVKGEGAGRGTISRIKRASPIVHKGQWGKKDLGRRGMSNKCPRDARRPEAIEWWFGSDIYHFQTVKSRLNVQFLGCRLFDSGHRARRGNSSAVVDHGRSCSWTIEWIPVIPLEIPIGVERAAEEEGTGQPRPRVRAWMARARRESNVLYVQ